jgi:hypothetical protein
MFVDNGICLFIPYTLLAYLMHSTVLSLSRDKIVSGYSISMVYNVGCLSVLTSSAIYSYTDEQMNMLAKHVISALIGYYCMDTNNLASNKHAMFRFAYIFHHIVSIHVLYMHYCGILPISIGVVYLTLFELSNVFIIPYQLCLSKGWTVVRQKLAHPMVWTYTPIRLVAVPVCSYFYMKRMLPLTFTNQYCIVLLCLINVLSMYYGTAIGYKYYLYLKLKSSLSYTKA